MPLVAKSCRSTKVFALLSVIVTGLPSKVIALILKNAANAELVLVAEKST